MLHLVFQSPLQSATLQRLGKDDAVLFLESATLYLLKNSVHSELLQQLAATNRLFVLVSEIETRGISEEDLITGITVIDYADWVNLTGEYQVIQSCF